MKKSKYAKMGLITLITMAPLVPSVNAQTSGSNGTHDPSRMIESEGKVYVYSTGGGGKSSTDGLVWASSAGVQPDGWAPWANTFAASKQGLWAPDGIFYNNKYFLFYSFCGQNYSGKNTAPCAVGVKTTGSLNPSSPNYKIVDQGMVAGNNETTTFGTIDPAPFVDKDGNLWVVWGGGFTNPTTANSIWATRLDNNTGMPLTTDPGYSPPNNPGHPLIKGRKEGSYVQYHNGYYYLFWNVGGCCSGTSSTYTIHMSRSADLTGPYPDDKIFYTTDAALNIHGPGHIGIYSCKGDERFTYHYYPSSGSVLGENKLTWGSDGWPVAGARVTTPVTLGCATPSTSIKAAPASPMDKNIRIQKSLTGYRIQVPEGKSDGTAGLFNFQGKQIGSFQTGNGWCEIPAARLASGMNFVRIASSNGAPVTVIVHKD
jgi:Glycosyl hydrolases family 43